MRDRRLHNAGDGPRCRTNTCAFPAQHGLGFCVHCEAIHRATQALRETLLARRGARLRARDPELFDRLPHLLSRRLVSHMAAQSDPLNRGFDNLVGLEDFFADLVELGLVRNGEAA